jgi:5-methylthioribose kinase
MIGNVEDLAEIWDTLETCYERQEKYVTEAPKAVLEFFRRYRMFDNKTVWELYSLLRATIKSTRTVGHLRLLINDQRISRIVGKMLHAEWKQWSTRQPEWILEDVEEAFEKFVEEKWKDALNMAAAESASWEIGVAKPSQADSWEDCDF